MALLYRTRSKGLPAALSAAPFAAGAVRALLTRGRIWLWGDQAIIDLEARDSLLGRNLLGVYDRFGWHHPGPLWLLLLGLFRFAGGGSAGALVFGSYAVQAITAAAIVVMAARLQPGLTAWWTALVVVGYAWDFGPGRLGTVWAPYAVALPAALLVLLAADFVSNEDPWPAALGATLCASFLIQTDVSTGLVTIAVVAVAVGLRLARRDAPRWLVGGRWRLRAAALAGVAVLVWLPPVVQQLTSDPGNLVRLADFFATHHGRRTWGRAFRALGTVFGSFPLRPGGLISSFDTRLNWLAATTLGRRPWYFLYLAGTAAVCVAAHLRRRRAATYLAGLCLAGLVAAGVSVRIAYGPLYPYLVVWLGALAVPAWVALWLALAPARRDASWRLGRRVVPPAAVLVTTAVVVSFATTASPMKGTASVLGRGSWEAVAAEVSAPGVRTVLIEMERGALPDAAAIADQVVRHGQRVEVDWAGLHFFDPSLANTGPAQLKVVICCRQGSTGRPPPGVVFRGRVAGESIYSSLVPSQAR